MKWLLLFIPMLAFANGDYRDDDDETIINTDIRVDGMSKNTFNAFAHSFGGVAIKDCIYTVQYFVFFQGAKINPLCVADQLDIIGKHTEAAEMRCSIKRYRKPYGNENQCIRVTMYVAPPLPLPEPEPVQETDLVTITREEEDTRVAAIATIMAEIQGMKDTRERERRAAAVAYAEDRAYKDDLQQQIEERFQEFFDEEPTDD